MHRPGRGASRQQATRKNTNNISHSASSERNNVGDDLSTSVLGFADKGLGEFGIVWILGSWFSTLGL